MMIPPQTKTYVHDLRKTSFAQLITIAFIASYFITYVEAADVQTSRTKHGVSGC
jgi:hypothetical protein